MEKTNILFIEEPLDDLKLKDIKSSLFTPSIGENSIKKEKLIDNLSSNWKLIPSGFPKPFLKPVKLIFPLFINSSLIIIFF